MVMVSMVVRGLIHITSENRAYRTKSADSFLELPQDPYDLEKASVCFNKVDAKLEGRTPDILEPGAQQVDGFHQ